MSYVGNTTITLELSIFGAIQKTHFMPTGRYVFSQITDFLPKGKFDYIVRQHPDSTMRWQLTHWNHLLVMIYGQLQGCASLRELTDLTEAHRGKSYHLGFGSVPVNRSALSKANAIREWRTFEAYAMHMISIAQGMRIGSEFQMGGKLYAFDSTTIDLCLSVFKWANFRESKAGIKLHTMVDIVSKIPTLVYMTDAKVHDVNAMDIIDYEPHAGYVFDRGYWDLARLFRIDNVASFFVIREKGRPGYEVVGGGDLLEDGNILFDQTVRFTGKNNKAHYPTPIRRVAAYIPELGRTFIFYTNNMYLSAKQVAYLYKNRWTVELFFKWIKQHLRVKTFWGESENAVRIQIYTAIITYCLIAIIENSLCVKRNIYEVMRILGSALLTRESMEDLLCSSTDDTETRDEKQLWLDFKWD